MIGNFWRYTGLLAIVSTLGGCITLLPEDHPAQLYRFAYQVKSEPSVVKDAQPPVLISQGEIDFPKEAASDRVVSVEGERLAYIAKARWAAPAPDLFEAAMSEGFARSGHGVRLNGPTRSGAKLRLNLKVRHFEVRYDHGHQSAYLDFDASLSRISDRQWVSGHHFAVEVPLAHNSMTDITKGFDDAVTKSVDQLIAFTEVTAIDASEAH